MANAHEIIAALRRNLAPVEQRLFAHPYVAQIESGGLPREYLAVFAGQQQRIISGDLRSVALLVHRYGDTPSGPFFTSALATESTALRHLDAFARALGLSPTALTAVEPFPGALAYTHFVAWLALYGSDAEFAAAFLVNLPAWGRNCAALARGLRAHYGMTDTDVAFFDLFAGDAPGFEEAALAVIQAGLDRGVTPTVIGEAAQLLQHYELLYWDTLLATARP